MITNESRASYDGNWLECITYRTFRCDMCHGDGRIEASKDSMLGWLGAHAFTNKLRWLLSKMHQWKKDGCIDCPSCGGVGIWKEKN